MSSNETEASPAPPEEAGDAAPKRGRTVAIVGRPNVGKSAIFNRFAGRRISIVHDEPGVTRDRISAPCKIGKSPFTVIDTGGIGAPLDDGFAAAVHAEADIAIETADVIVFVVDGQEGLTPIDLELASALRKTDRPVILAVNKIDDRKHVNLSGEFMKLGFKRTLSISAEHNHGFGILVAKIESELPNVSGGGAGEKKPGGSLPVHIAIIGRPNVGKSSMINALLGDERTIVSDVAGTTRDAVDVPFEHGGQDYILIDTAGLRQKNKRDSAVEIFSAMRTERTIRRADICAIVIDAAAGVTKQDMRIAQAVVEGGKPCIIVANKFDLYHPDAKRHDRMDILREEIAQNFFFLHYAPIIASSALNNENVDRLFREVEQVKHASRQEIGTGDLNRTLHELFTINPPPSIKTRKFRRLKLLYATMAHDEDYRPIPVPDFVMFVNDKTLLTDTYARYLENRLREKYPMTGLPLRFRVKGREKK